MQASLSTYPPMGRFEIPDFFPAPVAIGIACFQRPVHPQWARAMTKLQSPTGEPMPYIVLQGENGKGGSTGGDYTRIGPARDAIVQQAESEGVRYLLFVDDDTEPPADAFLHLLLGLDQNPRAAICAGLYRKKSDEDYYPVVWDFDGYSITEPPRTVFECGAIGAGCMLIDIGMLASIPFPRFHPTPDGKDDDILFCNRVRAAGYQVLAHGGVRCTHWGGIRGYKLNS